MSESSLIDIVKLLGVAISILVIFRHLNISAVLGYIVVGVLIGADGLHVIKDTESTQHFAEYGVVFLLFAIGLELTFDRLKEMRAHVFGFGSLQVVLCAILITAITYLMTNNWLRASIIGMVMSLSSTAVVLQVISDRGEQATQHGRLSLAALILQDLAFVPLMIVIPLLADKNANFLLSIGEGLLRAALALVLIVIVGKRLLGPLYRLIASQESHEVFIATTLLILLGSAWFTQYYGLSLAFGAFVAGLLVAETEYRHQVEIDLKPFKGLLMGLFFISVGMSIDLDILKDSIWLILTFTATICFCKTFIIYGLARAFGFMPASSIRTGMLLSQSSEFAFVLLGVVFSLGLLDGDLEQIFIISVALSMAITPLLASLSAIISRRIDLKNPVHYETGDIEKEVSDLGNHIIVVGFDNVGKTTCDLLTYKEIPYVIVDEDPRSVHYGRKNGYPIFYGKYGSTADLEKLGLERARLVALTFNDRKRVNDLASDLKKNYPNKHIVARAQDRWHARDLKAHKVEISIAENFESSLMIGNFILSSLGLPESELVDAINRFREREFPDSQIEGLSYRIKSDVKPV